MALQTKGNISIQKASILTILAILALSTVVEVHGTATNQISPQSIYMVGNLSTISNLVNTLQARNMPVAPSDQFELREAMNHKIVMMQSDWIKQTGAAYRSGIDSILRHGNIMVASFGYDAGNALSNISQNFLATSAMVYVGGVTTVNGTISPMTTQTVSRQGIQELPTDVVVSSLFTLPRSSARIPTVTLLSEGKNDPTAIADNILSMRDIIKADLPTWQSGITMPKGTTLVSGQSTIAPADSSSGLTLSSFPFTGSIGWLSAQFNDYYGSKAGVHNVMVQYYTSSQNTVSGTYYWILNYVQHWTTGYQTQLSGNFWPSKTVETIVPATNTWPGQVIWQEQPTGSTCSPSCSSVSYTIGVSNTGASASVTYSVSSGTTLGVSWTGDVSTGKSSWTQSFSNSQTGPTFNLQPAVIYELDPTKAGGTPPLITKDYFTAWFDNWAGSNTAPFIDFSAYVCTDPNNPACTKSQPNTCCSEYANIEIDGCPTTDHYQRSAGYAIDKPLPNNWWQTAGYEFLQPGGCFTYTTTNYDVTGGSNSLEVGISGFCPSYCWTATIKVNGNVIAQGNLDRNNHLVGTFSLP